MITSEQAENIYNKMHEEILCGLDSKELDALSVVMTSSVVIKAFGRSLAYCQGVSNEMAELNMADPASVVEFSKGQGQIIGIKSMITGLLTLVTKKEESDDSE